MAASLSVEDLLECVEASFRKEGICDAQAEPVARTIVAAERDACKSHGIYRIEGALRTIKAGKVRHDAVPELLPGTGGVVRVSANGGFASPELELPVLAERAEASGIAALAVTNAVHFSALWPR